MAGKRTHKDTVDTADAATTERPVDDGAEFCTCGVSPGPAYRIDARMAWRHSSHCPHAMTTKPTKAPAIAVLAGPLDTLTDRELDVRLAEALGAINELHRQLAEARGRFDALHDEKDRRAIRRRAAQ